MKFVDYRQIKQIRKQIENMASENLKNEFDNYILCNRCGEYIRNILSEKAYNEYMQLERYLVLVM